MPAAARAALIPAARVTAAPQTAPVMNNAIIARYFAAFNSAALFFSLAARNRLSAAYLRLPVHIVVVSGTPLITRKLCT